MSCFQAIFSVSQPDPDIFLVVRIEKVLQGSISAALEQYLRTTDVKAGTKIHKSVVPYCQKLGLYHMPFAWGARFVLIPFLTVNS
jgi:dedicator of cytokinesis protein 9/10/11